MLIPIIIILVCLFIFLRTIFIRPLTREQKIERLKRIINKKLKKRIKENEKRNILTTKPKYDEVYRKGTEWLNKQ